MRVRFLSVRGRGSFPLMDPPELIPYDHTSEQQGRRRPTSTTGAACGNAVAGRGYFGVPVPAQLPNGLSEL
eukprot:COSAG01_NODE_208_length_21996_cov_31.972097_25_plen_71_part_00